MAHSVSSIHPSIQLWDRVFRPVTSARYPRDKPSLRRDGNGVMSILSAVLISALLFFTGLSVDFGLAMFKKRQLQGATDLAAMAASQNPANAQAIAVTMLTANNLSTAHITSLVLGGYAANTGVAVGKRFVAGGVPANAVRLSTSFAVPMQFIRAIVPNANLTVYATATSAQIGEAGLEAGSGLVAISGGLENQILGGMLGTNVSLSLVSYQGLAQAQIDALDFLDALASQENISAGTYSQVLNSTVSVSSILKAEIGALNKEGSLVQGNAAAIAGLQLLAAEIGGSPSISVASLINAGIWQNAPIGKVDRDVALQATMNVYQLTSFAAQIANGSNLVNAASAINIPGVASVSIATTAIEPPQGSYYTFGPVGMSVHTAQIRLLLTANLLGGLPLPGVSSGSPISLPVYIEVASGTATLSSITCGKTPATDGLVGVSAMTGVVNAYVGSVSPALMSNFSNAVSVAPAVLVNAGLVQITAQANLGVNGSTQPLSFNQTQIAGGISQRASSMNMATNLLQGLQNDHLALTVLGQPIPLLLPTLVLASLTTLLAPVFSSLDSVADQALAALGVQVGYLDVTVTGERCGVPGIVQ